VPLKSLGTVSYLPSVVTMALSARYSDLLLENRKIFKPHLYLAPPRGELPRRNFVKMFDASE